MHGLPAGFDGKSFVGRKLQTVTFTPYAIYFGFGDDHSVTVNERVWHRTEDGVKLHEDVLPVLESSLPALLGRLVEGAEIRWPGNILLHLTGGAILSIDDHNEHYESYTVRTPDGEYFV